MTDAKRVFGRYQILSELGRGMMGVVYRAHDPDLGRDIALKVIQLPPGATDEDRANFELRFFAEARSAARLSHPGIVVVHDVGRDAASGAPYMALQLAPGKTLEHILKSRKRLEINEALQIARRVAEALAHAHSQGVVHRDVKPANIMILPNGDPLIMDFGIAKLETTRLTATGQFLGTPLYMSPEQAMVEPLDGRSDVFSLGSVLYEMLTGVPAFFGESITKILLQLIHNEPALASTIISGPSRFIDEVLTRCLAKDVHRRYQTAQEFADDLRDLLEDKPPRSLAAWSAQPSGVDTAPRAPTDWVPAELPADWAVETHDLAKVGPAPSRTRAWFVGVTVALGLLVLAFALWPAGLFAPEDMPALSATADEAITLLPTPSPTPPPPVSNTPPRVQPAQLIVDFEHVLEEGVLRIFVDDVAVRRRNLGAKVTRRIVGISMRKGLITETLQIPPGRHKVRVEATWGEEVRSKETETTFAPRSKLRLRAKLGSLGGLRKNLSLDWK